MRGFRGGNNAKYVKRPVDVDGVLMEIDDKLEYRDKSFVLKGLVWDGMDWYATDVFESTNWRPVNRCRHVKERTVEDVLCDLANEVWEASITCQTTWSDSGLDGIEKRYAAEIRELMEVGR